ncbi:MULTISPECIES: hypothetical protein [Haloferacaceae]|uniref:Uncharacterized protein n=1 Tax=Halorubrum glutamatedens TaxID=2707018 RepID=A0ABD5QNB7_9EURY|nr:hypothetical protein [Halobellus captivus]
MSENTITIKNSSIGNTIIYEGSTVIDNRTFVAVQLNETDQTETPSETAKKDRVPPSEMQEPSGEEVSARDIIDIPSTVVDDGNPDQPDQADLPVPADEKEDSDVLEVFDL